jgi:diguanylate cyclase (GGDEF)-like protein
MEVPADLPALEVDELFAELPDLRAVVARLANDDLVLVPRRQFQTMMTGRRGYGRSLHGRRRLGDLGLPPPLVFAWDTAIIDASNAIIERQRTATVDDVLVDGADEGVGIASTNAVMRSLADLHAYQAVHDPLTGLGNRAQLMEFLAQRPDSAQSAVLFLDLDRFKVVNDSLGHTKGDALLVEVAHRIARSLRRADLACRIGGDEFVVVLRDGATRSDAEELARRLLAAIEAPVRLGQGVVRLSTSIGIAVAPSRATQADTLVRQADLAMYDAKAHGRNRYALFDRALDEDAERRFALDSRLRQAVELDEFSLHFQPIVELATGTTIRYEALLRWEDPDRGTMNPADFVPMAEETRLIVPIGRWALEHALTETARVLDVDAEGTPGIAVNVSTVQLLEDDFVEHLRETIARTGVPSRLLSLEVTETAAGHHADVARQRLHEIRDLGVRIALDDFGTGSSSISLLRAFPIHEVKIDRSFVSAMLDNPADDDLVRLIIQVAHGVGMSVTAEGVEESEQVARLLELGCDNAQGYLYARPAPLAELVSELITTD